MKTMMKMLTTVAVVATALSAQSAMAQATDTATATAKVDLITPITVAKTTDLAFGKVAIPTTGAPTTVVLSTANVQTGTADIVGTQTTTVAEFAVSGDTTLAYTPSIKFETAGTTGLSITALTGKCGTQADKAVATDGSSTNLTSCVLASGADVIKVGGTLSVGSDAVAATAAAVGTLTVVVAYN